VFNQGML